MTLTLDTFSDDALYPDASEEVRSTVTLALTVAQDMPEDEAILVEEFPPVSWLNPDAERRGYTIATDRWSVTLYFHPATGWSYFGSDDEGRRPGPYDDWERLRQWLLTKPTNVKGLRG